MPKMLHLAFLLMLSLTACTPRIGVGVGGAMASSDGIAASEVVIDSHSGLHGSVSMGTELGL